MEKVPGAKSGMPVNQGSGQEDILYLHRPDLGHSPLGQRESRIQGGFSSHRDIGVQKFLENLGGRHQDLSSLQAREEELPSLEPEWVLPTYSIHQDVGIDEDHGSGIPWP